MELNLYQIIGELQVKLFSYEQTIVQLREKIKQLEATPIEEVEFDQN